MTAEPSAPPVCALCAAALKGGKRAGKARLAYEENEDDKVATKQNFLKQIEAAKKEINP